MRQAPTAEAAKMASEKAAQLRVQIRGERYRSAAQYQVFDTRQRMAKVCCTCLWCAQYQAFNTRQRMAKARCTCLW